MLMQVLRQTDVLPAPEDKKTLPERDERQKAASPEALSGNWLSTTQKRRMVVKKDEIFQMLVIVRQAYQGFWMVKVCLCKG